MMTSRGGSGLASLGEVFSNIRSWQVPSQKPFGSSRMTGDNFMRENFTSGCRTNGRRNSSSLSMNPLASVFRPGFPESSSRVISAKPVFT